MFSLATKSWVKELVAKVVAKHKGGNSNVYSTDETVVGTWIDGKPIYRKVFDNLDASLSSSGWKTVVSFDDVPIETPVNAMFYRNKGTTGVQAGKPTGQVTKHVMWVAFADENGVGKVNVYMEGRMSEVVSMLVLEYTKSTDTATT